MTELEVRKILAQNLKDLRKQFGLSQQKLANELQMAMTFINDIENCKKWVSPETLAKFSMFFNVPVGALFAGESFSEESQYNPQKENFIKIIAEELHRTIDKTAEKFLA